MCADAAGQHSIVEPFVKLAGSKCIIMIYCYRATRKASPAHSREDVTLFVRQCADLHIRQSIEILNEDIEYLRQLLDNSTVEQLGFSYMKYKVSTTSVDMASLQVRAMES